MLQPYLQEEYKFKQKMSFNNKRILSAVLVAIIFALMCVATSAEAAAKKAPTA